MAILLRFVRFEGTDFYGKTRHSYGGYFAAWENVFWHFHHTPFVN
jgi:hypothetical protein